MLRYIIRRILLLFSVLFGVSLLVFLVLHVFTVDPTSVILGQHATQEKQEALRQELGLNDPLYVQFGHFIGGAVTGDLGRSLFTKARYSFQDSLWGSDFPHGWYNRRRDFFLSEDNVRVDRRLQGGSVG